MSSDDTSRHLCDLCRISSQHRRNTGGTPSREHTGDEVETQSVWRLRRTTSDKVSATLGATTRTRRMPASSPRPGSASPAGAANISLQKVDLFPAGASEKKISGSQLAGDSAVGRRVHRPAAARCRAEQEVPLF